MKMTTKSVTLSLLVALLVAVSATAQAGNGSLTADEVVRRMVQQDAVQRSELGSYTARRRYVARNGERRAEMLVEVICGSDGAKSFNVISEEGSKVIRKTVLHKILAEETKASSPNSAANADISPANYVFRLVGQDRMNERPAYLLELTPNRNNKLLIDGRIWVDAVDYSIVRVEGSLVRSPSFWIRDVHFVHVSQKVGPFWLAASTHAVSETRAFGEAELNIETSEYNLNPPNDRTAKAEYPAEVPR